MSATGQGGVTLIAGRNHSTLNPVTIPAGFSLIFTHDVGRKAFSVLITEGASGQVLTSADDVVVTQPSINQIRVNNNGIASKSVFVSCRWEEPSPELDLVQYGVPGQSDDSRIEIEEIPR